LKNDFKIGASGGGDVAIIGLPKKGADASWEAGLVNILAGFNKIQPFTIVCNVAGKTAYLAVTDISISDRRAAAALISNRSAAVSPSVSSSSGIGLNAPAMKVHAPRTLSEMRAAANSSVSSSSNHNIGQYPPVQTNAASSPSVPQYYQPSIAPTSYNPVGVGSNEGWGMLDDSNFVYLADTYKPQAVQTSIQSTHEVTYPFRTPVLASSLSRSDINIIEKEIINPDINIQNAAHKKLFSAGVRKYLHNNAFDKMNVNGTYSEITFVHPDYQDALKPGFDENKVTCKMDSAGTKLIEICRHEKNNDLLIISAVGNNWPAMAYFSDSTEPTGYYVSHDPEFLKITVEKTKAAAQPAPQAVTVPSLNNLPQLTASSSSPNISTPLTGKINGKTKITFPFRTPFDDEQKAQEIRRDVLNNTIDDTAQFYKGVSISEHKKYILQRKYTIKNANNSFKQLVFAHQEYKDSSKEEFCREAVVFVMDDSGEKLLEIHRHKDKKLPVITITQPNDKQDLVLYSRGNENGKLVDFINDPNAVDVISYDTPGMKNIIGEPKDRDKEKHSAVVSSSGLPQDIAKKIINEKQNGVAPSYVDKFDKNNKGKGKGKEKESNISHKI
ncbi:MAG: hypothetical protein K0R98_1716, partial [Rickettsiaceae bacterium]|nr:hypothetical protein [Rickettsiaceae bacterium]